MGIEWILKVVSTFRSEARASREKVDPVFRVEAMRRLKTGLGPT